MGYGEAVPDMVVERSNELPPFLLRYFHHAAETSPPFPADATPASPAQQRPRRATRVASGASLLRKSFGELSAAARAGSELVSRWHLQRQRAPADPVPGEVGRTTSPPTRRRSEQAQPPPHRSTPDAAATLSPSDLPIAPLREALLDLVHRHPVVIVVGETGSGKTTQIPQYLLADPRFGSDRHAPPQRIACTQPRRVAAVSVARRVAAEMHCELGARVGYSIRFDDRTSAETRIAYLTDGMLLREAMDDVRFSAYRVIMIDEAHERSINTDVLLALLRRGVLGGGDGGAPDRPDLKVIVTSATLNAAHFAAYFQGAPVFRIPGRSFSVEVVWRPLTRRPTDYVQAAVQQVREVHARGEPGDILVFLTGQEEIEAAAAALERQLEDISRADATDNTAPHGAPLRLEVLPAYAAMPAEQQQRIFRPAPPNTRKCILATNIAEASLTIDGVRYVVDTGLSKQRVFCAADGGGGVERLLIAPISRASAVQRAGRAGRTAPGVCVRLYSARAFASEMLDEPVPEVQRADVASVVLSLLEMGVVPRATALLHGQGGLEWLDAPAEALLLAAMQMLWALRALDGPSGSITDVGRRMAALPLDPRLARVLLASVDLQCVPEALTAVAMLCVGSGGGGGDSGSGGDVFLRPRHPRAQREAERARAEWQHPAGDPCTLVRVYDAWECSGYADGWCAAHYVQVRALQRAREIRRQLADLLRRWPTETKRCGDGGAVPAAGRDARLNAAFTAGLFANAARRCLHEGVGAYTVDAALATGRRTASKDGRRSRPAAAADGVAYIHPSSALFHHPPPWLVYYELVETRRPYLRCCVAVPDARWLAQLAPKWYR